MGLAVTVANKPTVEEPLALEGRRDVLYETRDAAPFVFDAAVVEVFDDMITRSVPLYRETERVVASTVARSVPVGGHVVDLGASTGTGCLAIAAACDGRRVTVEGVDLSDEMVARATAKVAARGVTGLTFRVGDISEVVLDTTDAVTAVYTLQFVPPEKRAAVLGRIRAALPAHGVFVFAEKLAAPDATTQALWDAIHVQFKREQGYSEREITAKRASLVGVLQPWTAAAWEAAVLEAGFSALAPLVQWGPFATFVAWPGVR